MPDDLLGFLKARDASYCLACLAQAFVSVPVKQKLEEAQRAGDPVIISDGRCAICGQQTTVVAWVTGDPDLARMIRRIGR